ncbi:MAG: hypothetical protein G01um101420_553 [Parcubacteria group bacterium Gr01-1014_20]|nr:MAG: hypothetical protein G01um101420_553 [Parcubacteria group bacterium Gr01-1014_20]
MQLYEIKLNPNKKPKKRIGRGGKRGTFSGRGTKGQKSRAGRRLRKAERDLILRLPKRRGFRNKTKSPKPVIVNLSKLALKLKPLAEDGKKLTLDVGTLKQVKILPKHFSGQVKILGHAKLNQGFVVKGMEVSLGAKKAIEEAGGKIENLKPSLK